MLSKSCWNPRKIWEISAVEFDSERVTSLVPALRFRRGELSLTCPKPPSLVLGQSVAEGWGLETRERQYSSPETSRGLGDRVWPRDVPRSRSQRSLIPRPHSVSFFPGRRRVECGPLPRHWISKNSQLQTQEIGQEVSGRGYRARMQVDRKDKVISVSLGHPLVFN